MAVTTTDHLVPHKSTVPATKGQKVELFVRERDGTPSGPPARLPEAYQPTQIASVPGTDRGSLAPPSVAPARRRGRAWLIAGAAVVAALLVWGAGYLWSTTW
ncbi:hypothetical protein [Streptomyces sp. XD-27]|uniref:hypothetical protein n=1 Tax=Streptomyces sp. XD-27 TaxID=3062779 RepID=UPI0026F424F4|nr:hypothetical protein [Streptomyces sp. XD-27]WKX68620.1 hypothetical protein Q3Y56_00440 [Streptomyces sp. XD-27]